ncbi:MAG: FUSC family protein [Gemmataceae bacterium]|nr:FUSC family protein [Gemmataceae bacterium]MDW8267505.1 hypothetical protein [Gemmataceae bacterium]
MAGDKVTESIVAALKEALATPGEQRLFRAGKLAGLFPGRGGVHAAAARQALRDGLLETVRTETKGKTVIEWVRLTPRGVEFLHAHESPLAVLRDVRALLQNTREGIPAWLADVCRQLEELNRRLAADIGRVAQQLEALTHRVEEALRRAALLTPTLPDGSDAVPWAREVVQYLERRQAVGAAGECPLPELFAALKANHPELSLVAFHDGLRWLRDLKAIRLLPFPSPPTQLTEPEYALPDGAEVLYFVAR